jgi:hypothetical protein
MQTLSQFGDFDFLSPEDPTLNEGYPQQIFGHDCYLVRECNVMIINADGKLGVGTAQEMVIAKHFGKYVLTVLPRDSHHRRSNLDMHGIIVPDWIHPFVHQISDRIVAGLDELERLLRDSCAELYRTPPKTLRVVDEAIGAYLGSGHGRAARDYALSGGTDGIR